MSMPGLDAERDVAVSWGDREVGLDANDLDTSRQGVFVCACVDGWCVQREFVCVCVCVCVY